MKNIKAKILGPPPETLNAAQKDRWRELARIAPSSVTSEDRGVAELCCKLWDVLRKDGVGGRFGLNVGQSAELLKCFGQLGMTPAARATKADSGIRVKAIGKVPSYFSEEEKDAWKGIVPLIPTCARTESNRFIIEITCMLWAHLVTSRACPNLQILINLLERLGLAPAMGELLSSNHG